ncbi:esterase family protein [Gordonia araii NBRC 100433]|nr:alpha/beta hydrolase family protein [Gordonia araii]NNG98650.1 esterase family protein [Gordonia araii NBRC 100433]
MLATGAVVAPAEGATRSRFYTSGCGMPASPVDVWKRVSNYKTVIALDGLRATNDMSGWRHETNISKLADRGVNVVQPVGGLASFYTDWVRKPSNKQQFRYRWTCRLNQIIRELDARGMAAGKWGKYAIMGISMGGNSALTYAANHRRRISHAFSMSGYLNLSAPSMRESIKVALIDAGNEAGRGPYNADDMWGPPWNPRWVQNDPFNLAPKMRGMKVRIAAATGAPGRHEVNAIGTVKGAPLETASIAQTKAFETQAVANSLRLTTDYQLQGTHTWGYWQEAVWRAKHEGWFRDR